MLLFGFFLIGLLAGFSVCSLMVIAKKCGKDSQ